MFFSQNLCQRLTVAHGRWVRGRVLLSSTRNAHYQESPCSAISQVLLNIENNIGFLTIWKPSTNGKFWVGSTSLLTFTKSSCLRRETEINFFNSHWYCNKKSLPSDTFKAFIYLRKRGEKMLRLLICFRWCKVIILKALWDTDTQKNIKPHYQALQKPQKNEMSKVQPKKVFKSLKEKK